MKPKLKKSESRPWCCERAKEIVRALISPGYSSDDLDKLAEKLQKDFHDFYRYRGPDQKEFEILLPDLLTNFYGHGLQPGLDQFRAQAEMFCLGNSLDFWIPVADPGYNKIGSFIVLLADPDQTPNQIL